MIANQPLGSRVTGVDIKPTVAPVEPTKTACAEKWTRLVSGTTTSMRVNCATYMQKQERGITFEPSGIT